MKKSIGVNVPIPKETCEDANCPFHGTLSIRGKLFEGKVVSSKAKKTTVIQKEIPVYIPKYKRYARSRNTIHAHVPDCIQVQDGNNVLTAECRPISKSVSFVVIEVKS